MKFTVHEHEGEWVLRITRGEEYVGLGVLVGEEEASRVARSLNVSLADQLELDRWADFFNFDKYSESGAN